MTARALQVIPVKIALHLFFVPFLLMGHVVAQSSHAEAPMLNERVAAGELPPVEERLPNNPLLIEPHEHIGQYGGTWRTGLVGSGRGELFSHTGYDSIVRWTPDYSGVIPNVAESFEANEDAREFTFTLREGMRWSDGEPFTADDILFWYEHVVMNTALTPVPPIWLVSGGEPVVVEKIDEYTVVFRFSSPSGFFIQHLASHQGHDVTSHPRHYLEQFHAAFNEDDLDELVRQEEFAEWTELFLNRADRTVNHELPTLNAWHLTSPGGAVTQLTLERNPYYWKVDPEGNQLPYIDRVVYSVFEDPETLLLQALSGQIDLQMAQVNTPANRPVFFDNAERGDYRFFELVPAWSTATSVMLNLNHQDPVKREIFNNKDFRIGLSHAIDRQEIIDLIYLGLSEPWQDAPREGSAFYNEEFATQYLEHDPDLANTYLDQAGYAERDAQGFRLGPDGERITITFEIPAIRRENIDTLEVIEQHWEAVGIETFIRTMDSSLFWVRMEGNEYDATAWTGGGARGANLFLDPKSFFPWRIQASHFAPLWTHWYNRDPRGEEPPDMVRQQMDLYDQMLATANPDQQDILMRELLEIAKDQFYVIGISLQPDSYGIAKNNLRNIPDSMARTVFFRDPGPTRPEQYFFGN